MKRLFIVFAIGAVACTKTKPDWDQVSCERCVSVKTTWQEPEMIHMIGAPDTVANVVLCEDQLRNYQRMAMDTVEKICNTAGEPIYWIHYKDTSYISR